MERPSPPQPERNPVAGGCGALVGLLIGLESAFMLGEGVLWVALPLCGAMLCGWLAMRMGDRFWEKLRFWV